MVYQCTFSTILSIAPNPLFFLGKEVCLQGIKIPDTLKRAALMRGLVWMRVGRFLEIKDCLIVQYELTIE